MRTKLNEKNMMNVMGKINTFFKKDVKEDLGVKEVVVRYEKESIPGMHPEFTWDRPVYETKRVYKAYTGACDIHHLKKNQIKRFKEGEPLLHSEKDAPLLAIFRNEASDCIPLSEGSIIELKGSKLVITRKSYACGYSKHVFLQMEVSEEEREQEIKSGVKDAAFWYIDDTIWYDYLETDDRLSAMHCNSEIRDAILDMINEIDFMNTTGIIKKEVNTKELMEDHYYPNDDFAFTICINTDAVREAKMNDAVYLEMEGERLGDSFPVINKLFSDDSERNFEEENESDWV